MRGIRGLEGRRGEERSGSAIVKQFQRNKESEYKGRRQQRGEVGWRRVGLGKMGLSDNGERKKKKEKETGRKKRSRRERKRKKR